VWEDLRVDCPTWRRLLPETRDPRDTNWSTDDQWLLKTAYCNTGDDVTIRSLLPRKAWWGRSASARLFPNRWIAQKRFEITPIDSPIGAMLPCIGVYTINGIASGAYARLSRGPIVNYSAVDAALLVARDARDHERKEVEREPAICV
jgi:hypothetical protein